MRWKSVKARQKGVERQQRGAKECSKEVHKNVALKGEEEVLKGGGEALTLKTPNYLIGIFTCLKLCLADVIPNLK